MRAILPTKEISHVRDESVPAVEVEKVEQVLKPKTWVFIKNQSPKEKITFEDGSPFVWPGSKYVTDNPELAAKILKVAKKFGIVEA